MFVCVPIGQHYTEYLAGALLLAITQHDSHLQIQQHQMHHPTRMRLQSTHLEFLLVRLGQYKTRSALQSGFLDYPVLRVVNDGASHNPATPDLLKAPSNHKNRARMSRCGDQLFSFENHHPAIAQMNDVHEVLQPPDRRKLP